MEIKELDISLSEQMKGYLAFLEWATKERERSFEMLGIKEEDEGTIAPPPTRLSKIKNEQ